MEKKRIVTVYAHPDDESIISGGTLIKAVKQGHEVVTICATRGEAGRIDNPEEVTRETVGQAREAELRKAAEIIGIKEVFFLDYIDAKLAEIEDEEAVEKIVGLLNKLQPQVVMTFEPEGISYHPDHIQMHRWTMMALNHPKLNFAPEKIYWNTIKQSPGRIRRGKVMGKPLEEINTVVDVGDVLQQKSQAVLAHRTQWGLLKEVFGIREGKVNLAPKEYFLLVDKEGTPLSEIKEWILPDC